MLVKHLLPQERCDAGVTTFLTASCQNNRRPQSGVTLTELLVTITIAAILLTAGVPGMAELLGNARRDSQVAALVASMNYARSEAIKRGVWVTMCPSNTGAACLGDRKWESGWIVYADLDGDGSVDAGDSILKNHVAAGDEVTIRGAKYRIRYDSSGFSPGFNDTLRVCDSRGTADARQIIISNQGRARVKNGAATCP